MNYYKLVIAYDGTDYQGWQVQDNGPTVAGTLQQVFFEVFGKKISLFGASRTDSGVHAQGQVAALSTDLNLPADQLLHAWHNRLPGDIVIKSFEAVSQEFNPHHDVKQKEYVYRFCLQRPDPFLHRYTWHYRWAIDIAKLQEALSVLVGEHDFRSFCTGDDQASTVRTIDRIALEQTSDGHFEITFTGQRFLRYMIRRITGACIEVASRDHLSINDLRAVLQKRNPAHPLPCAPPQGLMLMRITYGK